MIDKCKTNALLDTGSQITTVAKWFFDKHFKDLPVETFGEELQINLADGTPLQYLGVVSLNLAFLEVDETFCFPTPVVIVSDTEFNQSCPVLLGTNVIDAYKSELESKFGNQFIQRAKISTPWKLALQCMNLNHKTSAHLGRLVSHHAVTIPPDSCVSIKGTVRVKTPGKLLIMTEAESFPLLPAGLVLTPSVHTVDFP